MGKTFKRSTSMNEVQVTFFSAFLDRRFQEHKQRLERPESSPGARVVSTLLSQQSECEIIRSEFHNILNTDYGVDLRTQDQIEKDKKISALQKDMDYHRFVIDEYRCLYEACKKHRDAIIRIFMDYMAQVEKKVGPVVARPEIPAFDGTRWTEEQQLSHFLREEQ